MTAKGLQVTVENLWRSYGPVNAVADVSLDVGAGEFVSLLGPSGSGKTTLLMMLAGFDHPQSGRITVGGRDITHVPANKRDIALVFQRYALFPHMSVADNILFPLKMRKMGRSERDARLRGALEMVKLEAFAERKPSELSGGQQQRVALARAIVFDPPVILMDEPLGALDKKLRQHMQIELKELQQRLGATVIYVTHDQEEALTMSDRVAVMNHGRLAQLGSPRSLYDHPANAFVAEFIGETSFVPGRIAGATGGICVVETPAGTAQARMNETLKQGEAAVLAVRPEHVSVATEGTAPGLLGKVAQVVFNGATVAVHIALPGGGTLRADVPAISPAASLQPGTAVRASWQPDRASLFPAAG
ncbi:MAG: polyamine-transporting ATPase [Cereibacter sp.]|jgi:putative spermidine/putrescine transport system ATP-binding protein/mannopine transport system ATP-binding protein|nr:polyamine-transporting ATPase [Cereibacter sp.]